MRGKHLIAITKSDRNVFRSDFYFFLLYRDRSVDRSVDRSNEMRYSLWDLPLDVLKNIARRVARRTARRLELVGSIESYARSWKYVVLDASAARAAATTRRLERIADRAHPRDSVFTADGWFVGNGDVGERTQSLIETAHGIRYYLIVRVTLYAGTVEGRDRVLRVLACTRDRVSTVIDAFYEALPPFHPIKLCAPDALNSGETARSASFDHHLGLVAHDAQGRAVGRVLACANRKPHRPPPNRVLVWVSDSI